MDWNILGVSQIKAPRKEPNFSGTLEEWPLKIGAKIQITVDEKARLYPTLLPYN
jgi:hypothetical protein